MPVISDTARLPLKYWAHIAGVKVIRAPKQKQQAKEDTKSPYSTPPAPKPALAAKKAAPSPAKQV